MQRSKTDVWVGLLVVIGAAALLFLAMQSANFRQRLTSTGFVIPATGSKPYTAFVKAELDQWTRVIKTAGIKPQ